MKNNSSHPNISYAALKLQDVLENLSVVPDEEYIDITTHRDQSLNKYQMIFSPKHIPSLTKIEFTEFLLFRNNHHWDSLHRIGKYLVEDMDLLRKALSILLDESIPVEDRINQLRPKRHGAKNAMVSYLGMPVLTPILLIVYPEKYGVWNNTTDQGLKLTRLWEKHWDSQPAGKTYFEMNQIYHVLCSILKIDLWTLDALWWILKKKEI
ncbi:MAG: hypothetical protein WCG34_06100 [Leptolinea sp.]